MPDETRQSLDSRIIHTVLEDGTPVCIRAIHPGDEALLRAGIERMSDRSRYLRFFTGGRTPPDWVIERLLDADGDKHLAWGAILMEQEGDEPARFAIGAVHAFREADDPGCAEFSVAILDEWHGLGLGKLLTATILFAAQAEGIERFHVETLTENRNAIDFTVSLGGTSLPSQGTTRGFVLTIDEALRRLRERCDPPGIAAVFAAFA